MRMDTALHDFEYKVYQYILQHRLIEKKDDVLLSLSGGADSTALLFVLVKLRTVLDFNLSALHFNHQLRKSALNDEVFCAQLCNKLNIQFISESADVRVYADEQKCSVETAGRLLRYHTLQEAKKVYGFSKIATAHHYDDHIETVIMHALRGSGLNGLRGIVNKTPDDVVRPMLGVRKDAILDYLQTEQIDYCTDETNAQNTYFRNKVRNLYLPALRTAYADCDVLLGHLSVQAQRIAGEISSSLAPYYEKIMVQHDAASIPIACFNEIAPFLWPYLLFELLCTLNGAPADIERKHLKAIIAQMNSGKTVWQIDLPGHLIALRRYEEFLFSNATAREEEGYSYPVNNIGQTVIEALNLSIDIQIVTNIKKPIKNVYEKYLDYDKIEGVLKLRSKNSGDIFQPLNFAGHKRLKKYFIEKKVPREQRARLPLLCDGDHIILIVGYEMDERYKITHTTKNIARVTVKELSTKEVRDA